MLVSNMLKIVKLIIILSLSVSATAESQPLVNTSYTYYVVTPQSPFDIISRLNSATPIQEHGEPFHAYTDSYVKWRFQWMTRDGYCAISEVDVSVDIRFTLPELGAAPRDVKDIWNKWYPKLLRHENNHKQHAVEIAKEIERGITRLPKEKNCKLLEKKANNLGHRLLKRLRQMDRLYDERTNHGETEGAWISSHLNP